jgi:hypothetical protein
MGPWLLRITDHQSRFFPPPPDLPFPEEPEREPELPFAEEPERDPELPRAEEPEPRADDRGCEPPDPLRAPERGLAEEPLGRAEVEDLPALDGTGFRVVDGRAPWLDGCDLVGLLSARGALPDEPVRSRVVRGPDILRYRSRTRSALCPSVACRGWTRGGEVDRPERSPPEGRWPAPSAGAGRAERRAASPRPLESFVPATEILRGRSFRRIPAAPPRGAVRTEASTRPAPVEPRPDPGPAARSGERDGFLRAIALSTSRMFRSGLRSR